MRSVLFAFVVATLALCAPVRGQMALKGGPSAPRNSEITFETLQDAVASVNGHFVRVPTGDRNEVLQVLWNGDNITVWYNGDLVPAWVEWSDEQVLIVTDAMSGGVYADGAIITFALNEHNRLGVNVSDYNDYNGARGTVGGANSRGSISTEDETVCRCWGGDASAVRTPCTTAMCDDAGTSCSTTVGIFCQNRATSSS
jgi:hypothetical protein